MYASSLLAKGNTATVYRYGENKIIKVFNDGLPPTEAVREATKQQLAYSYGLPVPKVIDATKIDGKQAVIMEYIEGKTVGDKIKENSEQADFFI